MKTREQVTAFMTKEPTNHKPPLGGTRALSPSRPMSVASWNACSRSLPSGQIGEDLLSAPSAADGCPDVLFRVFSCSGGPERGVGGLISLSRKPLGSFSWSFLAPRTRRRDLPQGFIPPGPPEALKSPPR
jgi:hypothetical protein